MLQFAPFLLCTAFLSLPFQPAIAQQAADGLIVPFTSSLPPCASLCGKLFDVQGLCAPNQVVDTSASCFCSDPRLQPLLQGPSGVSSVCGPESCQTTSDLQSIENWFSSYCASKQTEPSSTKGSGSASTGTSSGSSSGSRGGGNQGWFQTHWKWVVMLVVLVCVIVGLWVAACLLRRRYIRKKEREFEMRPPVAWGPHQMQAMTGGFSDPALDAGRNKEAKVNVQATNRGNTPRSKRESRVMKKQRT